MLFDPHFEFADEGILRDADVELYLLRLVHAIGYAAGDDGRGVAAAHRRVDVERVDVPVILSKHRRHISQ